MLELSKFKSVVENTPLVSIDLCLIFEGKIPRGSRLADEYTKIRDGKTLCAGLANWNWV